MSQLVCMVEKKIMKQINLKDRWQLSAIYLFYKRKEVSRKGEFN